MINGTVTIEIKGLNKFREVVNKDLRNQANGPVRKAFKQWAVRYRSFAQLRFEAQSKGGGEWPALKRKRRRGTITAARILRDTGLLFAALAPTLTKRPGAVLEDIPFGVRVGYGGPAGHKGSRATIADIAGFHDTGAGNLPKRQIIVPPDKGTLRLMADDMERALLQLGKDTIES